MTPPAARHPDFYARYAAAYAADLAAFVGRIRAAAPFHPDEDLGWKTLFVANLAEATSQSDGQRFDLVRPDGRPIATVDDAAAFANAAGVVV